MNDEVTSSSNGWIAQQSQNYTVEKKVEWPYSESNTTSYINASLLSTNMPLDQNVGSALSLVYVAKFTEQESALFDDLSAFEPLIDKEFVFRTDQFITVTADIASITSADKRIVVAKQFLEGIWYNIEFLDTSGTTIFQYYSRINQPLIKIPDFFTIENNDKFNQAPIISYRFKVNFYPQPDAPSDNRPLQISFRNVSFMIKNDLMVCVGVK